MKSINKKFLVIGAISSVFIITIIAFFDYSSNKKKEEELQAQVEILFLKEKQKKYSLDSVRKIKQNIYNDSVNIAYKYIENNKIKSDSINKRKQMTYVLLKDQVKTIEERINIALSDYKYNNTSYKPITDDYHIKLSDNGNIKFYLDNKIVLDKMYFQIIVVPDNGNGAEYLGMKVICLDKYTDLNDGLVKVQVSKSIKIRIKKIWIYEINESLIDYSTLMQKGTIEYRE